MFASVSASSRQGPRGLAREGSCARRSWRAAAASPQASSSSESDPGTKLALVSERERERYSREIPASRDAAPLIAGAPDDFFLLLRVSEDCDDDAEIKTSFRKLLKDAHPDKAGEAANDLAILMARAGHFDGEPRPHTQRILRFPELVGRDVAPSFQLGWSLQ